MEKNEIKEEKIEQKKKKKGIPKILYWLIVIIGLTFIYFMSYRIGQRIAENTKDKSTDRNVTEKSNNNENSNETSNEESNVNSNSNSNTTSNLTSNGNNAQVTEYSVKDFIGTFVSKEENKSYQFSSQATFLSDVYGIPGCGAGKLGNFVLEDGKIYMYPLVGTACDTDWKILNENAVIATIISKDEFQINGKSYKRTNNTSLNETDGGLRYGISVLESKSKNE